MANLTLQDSLEIANIAAGIVISKVGTTPIEKHELINELEDGFHGDKNKLISEKDLLSANKALEKIGILRDGSPFIRIKGKDLGSLIDSNMDDENKDFAPLLYILDILEHKMEQDDSLILLITDY